MQKMLSKWKSGIVITAILMISVMMLAACSSQKPSDVPTPSNPGGMTEATNSSSDVLKPSNPGGTGEAVNLIGDATAGAAVFAANCSRCHGDQGKGGIPNSGSDNGTVPTLNPIDPRLKNADIKVFTSNLDLFAEHGSTPKGSSPALSMPAWGDDNLATPQQIADVIAYVISLNK